MGGRKAAKRSRASDTSFAIATVTRNPHRFDRWLEYYRRLGAAHVFLAVEQTPEIVEYCAAQPHFVTVSETSAERNPYDSIIDRQVLHVDKALAACAERGIAWLFHVDDDELLHFVQPWESIVHKARVPLRPVTTRFLCMRRLAPIAKPVRTPRLACPPLTPLRPARHRPPQVPATADCLVIANVEAIPDHEGSDFTSISRFCVVDDHFLCYVNGKSAGRVGSAEACGCHRFSGEEWGIPHECAMVLHFESCPYSRWRDKFMHYASLQSKMSTIPFDFYLDSIRACRQHRGDEARLRAFWRRRKRFHYAAHHEAIKTVLHLGLESPEVSGRPATRRTERAIPPSPASLRHWGEMRREGLELG